MTSDLAALHALYATTPHDNTLLGAISDALADAGDLPASLLLRCRLARREGRDDTEYRLAWAEAVGGERGEFCRVQVELARKVHPGVEKLKRTIAAFVAPEVVERNITGVAALRTREHYYLATGHAFDIAGEWTRAALPGTPAVNHVGGGECAFGYDMYDTSAPWRVKFARGFSAVVTCSAADWLAHGDAVLAHTPGLDEVRLTTAPHAFAGVLCDHQPPQTRPVWLPTRHPRALQSLPGYAPEWLYMRPSRLEQREDVALALCRAEWPDVSRWTLPG